MTFEITAVYDTRKFGWGKLDSRIKRAFNYKFDGCGTFLSTGERDYSATRKKREAVDRIIANLRKIRGVKVTVAENDDAEKTG